MVDSLRRGFKAEAERLALSVRQELYLKVTDRLDCFALTDHLEIPAIALSELRHAGASDHNISRLMSRASGLWR